MLVTPGERRRRQLKPGLCIGVTPRAAQFCGFWQTHNVTYLSFRHRVASCCCSKNPLCCSLSEPLIFSRPRGSAFSGTLQSGAFARWLLSFGNMRVFLSEGPTPPTHRAAFFLPPRSRRAPQSSAQGRSGRGLLPFGHLTPLQAEMTRNFQTGHF